MNKEILLTKEDIHKGYLLLINHNFPIKHLINENDLDTIKYRDDFLLIDKIVKVKLLKALNKINSENKILCTDSYRSHQMQKDIYNNSLIENGKDFTESYVAKVDCSEHQSALAIDLAINTSTIDLIRPSFPNTGISKNFKDICSNYGFIERYQKEKEDITKISAEEWHFRYVGYPHSKIIESLNLCLEEYIDYLKKFSKKNPLVYEEYSIYYLKYQENIKIELNDNTNVSGNSVDGFIITDVNYEKNK